MTDLEWLKLRYSGPMVRKHVRTVIDFRKIWNYVNRDTPYGALLGTALGLPLGWLLFWVAVKWFNL